MNRVLVVVALILAVSANGVAAEQDGDSYIQKPIVAESVVRGPDGKIKVDIPEKPESAIDMKAGACRSGSGSRKSLLITIRLS